MKQKPKAFRGEGGIFHWWYEQWKLLLSSSKKIHAAPAIASDAKHLGVCEQPPSGSLEQADADAARDAARAAEMSVTETSRTRLNEHMASWMRLASDQAAAEKPTAYKADTSLKAFEALRKMVIDSIQSEPLDEGGLSLFQETKYTIRDNKLVNRASGKPVPDDVPVFIFLATDVTAVDVLLHAAEEVSELSRSRSAISHRAAILKRAADFLKFSHEKPERMKVPDTDPNHQ